MQDNNKVTVLTSKEVQIEGSPKEVVKVLKDIGESKLAKTLEPLYYSESTGEYLLISEMATPHIKNAARKKLYSLVQSFDGWNKLINSKEFLNTLLSFLYTYKKEDKEFNNTVISESLISLIDLLDELKYRML